MRRLATALDSLAYFRNHAVGSSTGRNVQREENEEALSVSLIAWVMLM